MNIKAIMPQGSRVNWKQIGLIAVILGVAAFQYVRTQQKAAPEGSESTAKPDVVLTLPDQIDLKGGLGDRDNKQQTSSSAASASNASLPSASSSSADSSEPYLQSGQRNTKISPVGLVYTGSRSGEHRTDHVLAHAKDAPNRRGNHGVFDADGDDVFRLVDEAYRLIQKNSSRVSKDPPRDGKTAYTIDMQRRIGYRGGQSGNRDGRPATTKMKLVLVENRVITAYPF